MIPGFSGRRTLSTATLNALADSLVRHIDETLQTHVELHEAPHARRLVLDRIIEQLKRPEIGVPR